MSQVKEAGLSDELPGISKQEALCLVKPEALKYKGSRTMLHRNYVYLVQGFPQWHLRREEDPDISAPLLSRLVRISSVIKVSKNIICYHG